MKNINQQFIYTKMNLTENLNLITNDIKNNEDNFIKIVKSEELKFLIPNKIFHIFEKLSVKYKSNFISSGDKYNNWNTVGIFSIDGNFNFWRSLENLKIQKFKLDEQDINNFSECTYLESTALLSYRMQKNFTPFYLANTYIHVRKINISNKNHWVIELHFVKNYISNMWHEEFINSTTKYKKNLLEKFDKEQIKTKSFKKYLKKNISNYINTSKKQHELLFPTKMTILNKYVSEDFNNIIKQYYSISKQEYFKKENKDKDYLEIRRFDEEYLFKLNKKVENN